MTQQNTNSACPNLCSDTCLTENTINTDNSISIEQNADSQGGTAFTGGNGGAGGSGVLGVGGDGGDGGNASTGGYSNATQSANTSIDNIFVLPGSTKLKELQNVVNSSNNISINQTVFPKGGDGSVGGDAGTGGAGGAGAGGNGGDGGAGGNGGLATANNIANSLVFNTIN